MMRRRVFLGCCALIAGCAEFPEFPTAPAEPRCIKYAFVLTDASGKVLGDTTWVYDSPVVGVACRP